MVSISSLFVVVIITWEWNARVFADCEPLFYVYEYPSPRLLFTRCFCTLHSFYVYTNKIVFSVIFLPPSTMVGPVAPRYQMDLPGEQDDLVPLVGTRRRFGGDHFSPYRDDPVSWGQQTQNMSAF